MTSQCVGTLADGGRSDFSVTFKVCFVHIEKATFRTSSSVTMTWHKLPTSQNLSKSVMKQNIVSSITYLRVIE